jgi:hypothetical protein
MRVRCDDCGKLTKTEYACKVCGGTNHFAHCHDHDHTGPHFPAWEPDHDWRTYPHRHPHDGLGHKHDTAGNIVSLVAE